MTDGEVWLILVWIEIYRDEENECEILTDFNTINRWKGKGGKGRQVKIL